MVNNGRIKGKMGNGINFGTDVICIRGSKYMKKKIWEKGEKILRNLFNQKGLLSALFISLL